MNQPSTLLYPHRYAVGIFVLDENTVCVFMDK